LAWSRSNVTGGGDVITSFEEPVLCGKNRSKSIKKYERRKGQKKKP